MDCKQEIKHYEKNAKKNNPKLRANTLESFALALLYTFLIGLYFFYESGEVYIYMYRRPNRDVIILKQGHR